ncbi:DUF3014 domain-containing protein [Halioxenophilus aromaticivorans]|uniref:DUF3014 domain-containing protein n=1 Tax=Halioxenophilus aromaticivorans TaxID=1306992 RepID=A0AAV3TXN0_9ALTE
MPERIGDHTESKENPALVWLSVIAVVVIVGLCVWWVMRPTDGGSEYDSFNLDADAVQAAEPITTQPELADAPDIPELAPEPEVAPPEPTPEAQTNVESAEAYREPTEPASLPEPSIPNLEDSDPDIKAYFGELSADTDYQLLWQTSNLLQRWITVFDGAAQGKVIKGVIGFKPPKGKFPVEQRGANYYVSEQGYERYNGLVETIVSLDAQQLSAGFHRFRPLFEQAYGQMGYDPEQMDNTIIRVLDRIIAAPIFPGSIELTAKSVNYTFVDEGIESLPALEKQLIRMGPENTTRLQNYAKALRQTLLNPKE